MMDDLPFVVAAYAVILGGLGLYTVVLWRRLQASRHGASSDDLDDEAR
jgi:hypothetical protein